MATRETYKQKAEKLYKKQQRRVKDLKKRGYIIESLKPLPKRIGKREYERLQKTLTLDALYDNPKNLYHYLDTETMQQKVVSAKKGREIERSKAAKKGAETRKRKKDNDEDTADWVDVVLNGIIEQIKTMSCLPWNQQNGNLLLNLLINAIADEGKTAVANRIYKAEQKAKFLIDEILHPSPRPDIDSMFKIAQFAELIKGSPLDKWESVQLEDYMDEYYAYYYLDDSFDI